MGKIPVKFSDIINSKGMEYINRAHFRTHTLNIFIKNTELLIEALQRLHDPKEHLKTLSAEDKEHGRQILRDITCLAHNFLAGATTLVDHTRIFVKEYYIGTEVNKVYRERVERDFAQNELTRFIQDLRNYMVHRGPIPLSRTFTMKPIEGGSPGEVTATSGFYVSKSDLLTWSGWKSEAKKFLSKQNDQIELLPIIEAYRDIVYLFHDDLDDLIREHHKDDLKVLEELDEAFQEQESRRGS